LQFPLIMIASTKFGISLFTESRVPLQSRGGFKLRNIIITVPTLSCKFCCGNRWIINYIIGIFYGINGFVCHQIASNFLIEW